MQIIVMGNLAISSSAINYKRDASLKFPASQEAIETERGGAERERGRYKVYKIKNTDESNSSGGPLWLAEAAEVAEGGRKLEMEIYERKIICGIW